MISLGIECQCFSFLLSTFAVTFPGISLSTALWRDCEAQKQHIMTRQIVEGVISWAAFVGLLKLKL